MDSQNDSHQFFQHYKIHFDLDCLNCTLKDTSQGSRIRRIYNKWKKKNLMPRFYKVKNQENIQQMKKKKSNAAMQYLQLNQELQQLHVWPLGAHLHSWALQIGWQKQLCFAVDLRHMQPVFQNVCKDVKLLDPPGHKCQCWMITTGYKAMVKAESKQSK